MDRNIVAVSLAFSLCAATMSTRARAEPSPSDKAAVEALFDEAKTMMKDGRAETACTKLTAVDGSSVRVTSHQTRVVNCPPPRLHCRYGLPFPSPFRWLVRQNVLVANPASDLEMPRREKRLPKHVLGIAEVERVLALPKQNEILGLRDRAILEVLYATGLRAERGRRAPHRRHRQ